MTPMCSGSAPPRSDVYAGVLMKTVKFLQAERPVAVAFTSAMAHRHSLVERVERILAGAAPARWSWSSRLVALLVLGLLPLSVGRGAAEPEQEDDSKDRPSGAIRATTTETALVDDEQPPVNRSIPPHPPGTSHPVELTANEALPQKQSRVQVKFVGPTGMAVDRETRDGEFVGNPIRAPGRFEFTAGQTYRLKLDELPAYAGLTLYPTLQVAESHPRTARYLAHNSVPIKVTEEDLDQITTGNFVTKVIYLPDPEYQAVAVAGVETLVSTRLDPGVDPVAEADRRGTILAILRVGNRAESSPPLELAAVDRPPVATQSAIPPEIRGLPIGEEWSVRFTFEEPQGMTIDHEIRDGQFSEGLLRAPGRIEVAPGLTYRLKLDKLPGYAGLTVYPTLEVAESHPSTTSYLKQHSVPIKLTDKDLNQIESGSFVTKVIYLLDSRDQAAADPNVFTLYWTRQSPPPAGVDVIAAAGRRGTILAVLRVGDVDLSIPDLVPFDRPYGEIGFPGSQFGPHWETVRLATNERVQDELGLKSEQRRALKPIYDSLMKRSGTWSSAGRDEPNLLQEEYDRTRDLLTEEQQARLDQIIFRRLGFLAFVQPKYAKQIGLTARQQAGFQLIWNEHAYRAYEGWKGTEGREAYHKLQADAFAELRPEQRRRYAALIGPPVSQSATAVSSSQDDEQGGLPEFDPTDGLWLPPDTESLIIAQKFICRPLFEGEIGFPGPDELTWDRIMKPQAILPLLALKQEVRELFLGQPIVSAFCVGRNYKTTSAFGSYRFDGCSVIHFASPILRATDKPSVLNTLRESATERWTISDRNVFVFRDTPNQGPSTLRFRAIQAARHFADSKKLHEEGAMSDGELETARLLHDAAQQKLKEEHDAGAFVDKAPRPSDPEELYVVRLDDRRLMVATDDVFLVESLRRMNGEPTDKAFTSAQAHWNDVDSRTELWGLRLVPEKTSIGAKTSYSSVAWSLGVEKKRLNVVLRRRKEADVRESVQKLWGGSGAGRNPFVDVETRDDRSIHISVDADTFTAGRVDPLFTVRALPNLIF